MTLDEMIERLQGIRKELGGGTTEVMVCFNDDVYSQTWTVPTEYVAVATYDDGSVNITVNGTFNEENDNEEEEDYEEE